jgi:hypothetical protein
MKSVSDHVGAIVLLAALLALVGCCPKDQRSVQRDDHFNPALAAHTAREADCDASAVAPAATSTVAPSASNWR